MTNSHGKAHPDQETLTLTEKLEQKLREACERYDQLHDRVDDLSSDLIKTVKKRPIASLAVAMACGVLIGKIFK